MARTVVFLTYATGIALIALLIGTALTRVIVTAEMIGRNGPDLWSVLLLVMWPVGGFVFAYFVWRITESVASEIRKGRS